MSKPSKSAALDPVRLLPVHIPKPWGQEIWYSGMEERGESQVKLGAQSIGLSAYLASYPEAVQGESLLLLKVLDPKPDPVLGDLYFEVHEEKQEVYVVTHIDASAWPEGRGQIRFGMNQGRRTEYKSDQDFIRSYRQVVGDYEKIRRTIDNLGTDATVAEDLLNQESRARAAMDAYTAVKHLNMGDVVRVPTWTPHALQHGVRVVEFQTQTYERYIVSFAQKVLTQDHWDTDHALTHMSLDTPSEPEFEAVSPGIERIARFEDFNVWRCDGQKSGGFSLPEHIPYAVVMALGEVSVGKLKLSAEQACLIPHAGLARTHLISEQQLLVAAPGL